MSKIFIASDNTVSLSGVRDLDKNYLNSGTCTYELRTKPDDTLVTSGTLDYVDDSDGDYEGIIDASVTAGLTEKAYYNLSIIFRDGEFDLKRRLELQAVYN